MLNISKPICGLLAPAAMHNSNYRAYAVSNNGGGLTIFRGADDLSWTTWQIEDHDNQRTGLTLCVQHKASGSYTCGASTQSVNPQRGVRPADHVLRHQRGF